MIPKKIFGKTKENAPKKRLYYQKGFSIHHKGGESMDDCEIIGLCFDRNEAAISEIEKKYGRLCSIVANKILGNAEDSEECVNDAFLKVWNSIPPAKPSSLKGYICKITRNLALMRLRHDNRQKRSSQLAVSLSELEEVLPDNRINPAVDSEEIAAAVNSFLIRQRPVVRKIFVLKYVYFYTQKEIAEHFSFSENKVNSMLFRARKKLREHLEKEGIEI